MNCSILIPITNLLYLMKFQIIMIEFLICCQSSSLSLNILLFFSIHMPHVRACASTFQTSLPIVEGLSVFLLVIHSVSGCPGIQFCLKPTTESLHIEFATLQFMKNVLYSLFYLAHAASVGENHLSLSEVVRSQGSTSHDCPEEERNLPWYRANPHHSRWKVTISRSARADWLFLQDGIGYTYTKVYHFVAP